MKELEQIYETLKTLGFCSTRTQFSREWLGRSAHYMSQIGGDPRMASITSLCLLASKLELATVNAKASDDYGAYRKLRSAFVAASTVRDGVFELRHVQPFWRVTAKNLN